MVMALERNVYAALDLRLCYVPVVFFIADIRSRARTNSTLSAAFSCKLPGWSAQIGERRADCRTAFVLYQKNADTVGGSYNTSWKLESNTCQLFLLNTVHCLRRGLRLTYSCPAEREYRIARRFCA